MVEMRGKRRGKLPVIAWLARLAVESNEAEVLAHIADLHFTALALLRASFLSNASRAAIGPGLRLCPSQDTARGRRSSSSRVGRIRGSQAKQSAYSGHERAVRVPRSRIGAVSGSCRSRLPAEQR